ncbi:MAG: sigma-70 family RNA polymerase sigma factor [Thermoguttaceae bacterium]|jgi:RNA polymerase sigma-70 factor (ECF subfamily)
MNDVSDLVIRAKGGDHQAFADLYDQFAPLVRSLAYDATGSLQESEDLCQEVFLHVYRKIGQLRDPPRFVGWLITIARRHGASWRRSRRLPRTIGLEGIDLPDAVADFADEEVRRLLDAVRRLPDKERTALHLFYLTGQPAAAACESMNLSNSGFYKVLERAKKRVAWILQKGKAMR